MNGRIVHGMPAADYHAARGVNASTLKALRKSPAHYYGLTRDPHRPPRETSAAMKAGTLAHAALLEPETLASRYVVKPTDLDMRTKAGKEWRAAQALEVIDADQMAAALAQAASVKRDPEAASLLASGAAEVSAFWEDPETGRACKCRADWVHETGAGVILVDVKTCQDASPKGFARAVDAYGYHLQAAWYARGYALASGSPVLGFVFAAVESDWPHVAANYMLADDVMEAAQRENARLLRLYIDCESSGKWPGYPSGVNLLTLPKWAQIEG